MKKIISRHFPFKGYKCMALVWWIIIRKDCKWRFRRIDERHEEIHGRQQREMLIVPFFLWYAVEFLVRLCIYRNWRTAYKNISFEREAYDRQYELGYLDYRKKFAWIKYL